MVPLLLTIIILNAVLIETLRGEVEDVVLLKAEVERCLSQMRGSVNGSIWP